MKAIVVREYGGPEVMRLENVETPSPGRGEVLVKISAAGVNPVDTYLRSGKHAHAPSLPYTPGKDGAGVVEVVGADVSGVRPGERVYTAGAVTGTYADYSLCREDHLGALPDNIGFDQGAGIWTPYATSYRALFQKCNARAGETVLVHGASGGVGIAAVQWARAAGLRVIGTAGSDEGLQLVAENGAHFVADHTDPNHFAEISSIASGRGVDLIIEMLANVNLERDFEALAIHGRIVIVGSRGSINFTPRNAMTKETTIYGMSLFNSSTPALGEIKRAIYDGLRRGSLKPIVRRTLPLADASEAHRSVIEDRAFGKIVLTT